MTTEPKTHLWLKPCGCVAELVIDKESLIKDIQHAKRNNQRCGNTYIGLVETESVRHMEWDCPEHKALEERLKREKTGGASSISPRT